MIFLRIVCIEIFAISERKAELILKPFVVLACHYVNLLKI